MLFRTAEGTKLVSAAINNSVLFEADDHNVAEGWSVIVKGMARLLRTDEEIDEAERASATAVDGDGEATLRSDSPAERHGPAVLVRLRARPRSHRCVRSGARPSRDTQPPNVRSCHEQRQLGSAPRRLDHQNLT